MIANARVAAPPKLGAIRERSRGGLFCGFSFMLTSQFIQTGPEPIIQRPGLMAALALPLLSSSLLRSGRMILFYSCLILRMAGNSVARSTALHQDANYY